MQRPFSKYYSIFNDGIHRGSMEVTAGTRSENFEVIIIPWALTNIPRGSINTSKLLRHIMFIISSINIQYYSESDHSITLQYSITIQLAEMVMMTY